MWSSSGISTPTVTGYSGITSASSLRRSNSRLIFGQLCVLVRGGDAHLNPRDQRIRRVHNDFIFGRHAGNALHHLAQIATESHTAKLDFSIRQNDADLRTFGPEQQGIRKHLHGGRRGDVMKADLRITAGDE